MTAIKLRWSGHSSSLLTLFDSFLSTETLVDVTLAAEGKHLKAHRVILCACSPFFQDLISNLDKEKHPIIFLKGVRFHQLQRIVQFIYRGEIEIPSEELPELLTIAEELKIRGITDSDDSANANANFEQQQQQQQCSTQSLISSISVTAASSSSGSSKPKQDSLKDPLQLQLQQPPTLVPSFMINNANTEQGPVGADVAAIAVPTKRLRIRLKRDLRGQQHLPQPSQVRSSVQDIPEQEQGPIQDQDQLDLREYNVAGMNELDQEEQEQEFMEEGQVKVEEFGAGSRVEVLNTDYSDWQGGEGGAGENLEDEGQHSTSMEPGSGAGPSGAGQNEGGTLKVDGVGVPTCTICGKIYTSSKSLWRHRKFTSCGDDASRMSFYCLVCGKGFSRSDNLRRHSLVAHCAQ